jgi:lipoprotein-anchoring transpeptidase ErfK/SrfK
VAVAATALAAAAGCTNNDPPAATGKQGQAPAGSTAPAPATPGDVAAAANALTISPGDGVTNAPVRTPLQVSATDATLDAVTVVDGAGGRVAGQFTADKRGWKSTGTLKYRTSYTATVTATDAGGRPVTRTSKFTTVKPANLTMPYLRANADLALSSRKTYGVGQPIVVRFDERIPDRKAAEKSLKVTTNPPVTGAWHWYTDQQVHWRPQKYWASGTKVSVTADVYGVDLGRGLYGEQNRSASFTIGEKHVAIADDNTDHIRVFINDKLTRTVPTSMGKHQTVRNDKGQTFDLRTRSGAHVVLGTAAVTEMTGASWGLTGAADYKVNSRFTTRLSYQGEYLHEKRDNVAKHGRQNDSHGCLNLGTNDARWFMNNFIPGDVVEVKNTGIQLAPMDGLTDWNMSWRQWLAGSALGEH